MPDAPRELATCRADFPALARAVNGRPLTFLDGPAGTQVPQAVIDAIAAYYERCNANTHGQFVTSRESDALLEATRSRAAAFLGAPSGREVSFGANMTTLCFALAHAIGREMAAGDEAVITQLDHEANRGPWLGLAERGVVVREVALGRDGRLDYDDLRAKVGPRTRVLALGLASNALGTVNDIALARELTRAVGAWLVLDAVHWAPHFAVDVSALDPDFLLCSAYKFYGPHVGILYCRPGLLETLRTDRLSTQDETAPWRIETGTLNHAAIAGVGAAIDYLASFGAGADLRGRVADAMGRIERHERALAVRYFEAVQKLPGVRVWGPDFRRHRAPTVSTMRADNEVARLVGAAASQLTHFYAARAIEAGLAERCAPAFENHRRRRRRPARRPRRADRAGTMSSRPLRALLLGFGNIGRKLADILSDRAAHPGLANLDVAPIGIVTGRRGALANEAGIDLAAWHRAGQLPARRRRAVDSAAAVQRLDFDAWSTPRRCRLLGGS
jgi:cysteine desulfurase family protein (TIGR01976 family)